MWVATDVINARDDGASMLGVRAASTVLVVGVAYIVVLAIGMARHGLSEPIADPILAVMEILTILSALPLLALIVAVHGRIDTSVRHWATLAVSLATMFAAATMGVHVVELTAGRALGRSGLVWPSVSYAVELFAWDWLLGLTLLTVSLAVPDDMSSRALRRWLRLTGTMCLVGLAGPLIGNMRLQLIGVFGYAVLLPVVAWLFARWFRRPLSARVPSIVLVTVVATCVAGAVAGAQSTAQRLRVDDMDIDSLRARSGTRWRTLSSRHFTVHIDRASALAKRPSVVLDSLEEGWRRAVTLVGATVADASPITVLFTTSTARFPRLMSPDMKGLATQSWRGADLIVLVHNDSVRAHYRHEVMHVISTRAWGPISSPSPNRWLGEGIAVLADGRCHGAPIVAVARDLLRRERSVTVGDIVSRVEYTGAGDRATAYVLAGALVEFLHRTRGPEGLRRLWSGRDSVALGASPSAQAAHAALTDSLRSYVETAAAGAPAFDLALLERWGCG